MPITYPRTQSDWFDLAELSRAREEMKALLSMKKPVNDSKQSAMEKKANYYTALRSFQTSLLKDLRASKISQIEQHLRSFDLRMMRQLGMDVSDKQIVLAVEQLKDVILEKLHVPAGSIHSDLIYDSLRSDYTKSGALDIMERILSSGPAELDITYGQLRDEKTSNDTTAAIVRLTEVASERGGRVQLASAYSELRRDYTKSGALDVMDRILSSGPAELEVTYGQLRDERASNDTTTALVRLAEAAGERGGRIQLASTYPELRHDYTKSGALDVMEKILKSGPAELSVTYDQLRTERTESGTTAALERLAAAARKRGGRIRLGNIYSELQRDYGEKAAGVIERIAERGPVEIDLSYRELRKNQSPDQAVSALEAVAKAATQGVSTPFRHARERSRAANAAHAAGRGSFRKNLVSEFDAATSASRSTTHSRLNVGRLYSDLRVDYTPSAADSIVRRVISSGPVNASVGYKDLREDRSRAASVDAIKSLAKAANEGGGVDTGKLYGQLRDDFSETSALESVRSISGSGRVICHFEYKAIRSEVSKNTAVDLLARSCYDSDAFHRKDVSKNFHQAYQSEMSKLSASGKVPVGVST